MNRTNSKGCELANSLRSLPAEQIKKAVINLLNTNKIEHIDWEHGLSTEIDIFQEWIDRQRRRDSSS